MKNTKDILFKFEHLYDFKNIEEYINIPYLSVEKNKKNGLFLLGENKILENKTLKKIVHNTNANYSYFEYDNQNNLVNITDMKLNNFNNIAYFDINNVDSLDNEIPFLYQLKIYEKTYKIDKKRKNILWNLFNKNEFFIKNEFIKSCNEYALFLKDTFRNLDTILKTLNENIKNNFLNKKYWIFNENIKKFLEEIEEYEKKLIESELEFLKKWAEKIEFLNIENSKKSEEELELLTNNIEYNFLSFIREKSQKNLKHNLYIRDEKNVISTIKNNLKEHKKIIKKYFKYVIDNFFDKTRVSLEKANNFRNIHSVHKYLLKTAYLNHKCGQILKKYYHKMLYLNIEDIEEMVRNLEFEQKMFSVNFLNKIDPKTDEIYLDSKIKKDINNNFYFPLDIYIARSKDNYEKMKSKIFEHLNNIKEELNYKTISRPEYDKDFEKKRIKDNIEKSKSNKEWNTNKIKKEYIFNKKIYSNDIKKTFNNLISYKKILENYKKEFIKKLKLILNKNNDELWKKETEFLLKNLDNNILFNQKFKFISNIIYSCFFNLDNFYKIKEYLSKYQLIFKILLLNEKTSIKYKNLIRPFNTLEYISKIKLLLSTKMIYSPKLLIITDYLQENKIDQNVKKEILRVVDELCKNNKTTQLFLTKDVDLLSNFDVLYVISNDKLIEYGETEEIIKYPIHPFLKHKLQNRELLANDIYFNEYEYLYSNIYYINDNHFLIGPSKWIKKWIKNSENSNEKIINNVIEENENQNKVTIDSLTVTQENEIFDDSINEIESLILDYKTDSKFIDECIRKYGKNVQEMTTEFNSILNNEKENTKISTIENENAY